MSYIDGFVAAAPTANKLKYKKHAEDALVVFKEYGAISAFECWGDEVPEGEATSFPLAVKLAEDETVVFAWIVWPSKQLRDQNMQKCMKDPRLSPEVNPMPFDGKRMIYGSFDVLVQV